MKKTGNYIKITLHRIKICSDINLSSYNLKISFGRHSCETDKICMKEVDYGGKSFFFDLAPGTKQSNIEISAISKTLFIFDSNIAKVTIPFNLNKFDDKREWYYLKNLKEENMIGVLISIYCELKPDFSINIENIPNSNTNNSYLISKSTYNINMDKRESSYDVNANKSNIMNIINKSHNNSFNNIQRIVVNNSLDDIKKKDKDVKSKSEEDDQTHLDNTIICQDNYKSPDLSTLSNNMFSPASYRLDGEKSHFNYNLLNLSNLNSKLNTSNKIFNKTTITSDNFNNDIPLNNFLSHVDSFSEVKNEESGDYNSMVNKLKQKAAQLQDEQERLKRLNDEILKNREKIKQKEAVIIREKEKLESYIKNFKANRSEFEKKTNKLNENFNKLNSEISKFSLEKEILQFDKQLFLNLNLYSCVGKFWNGVSPIENQEGGDLRKKSSNSTCTSRSRISYVNSHTNIPHNNSNSTLATTKHNAKSSYNSETRKKEIVLERPSSRMRKGENDKENYSRKDSQSSTRGSVEKEQAKILRSFTNSNLIQNISNSNINQSELQFITSDIKEINSNINPRDKDSKFYPPIAQIDLNYKKKNGVNNVTSFDLLSPIIEKPINQETNRLIDSLDNFSLMYSAKPSNINTTDRKEHNCNKLILATDEQKSLSKRNEENKRKLITNKSGFSGALVQVSSGQSSSNTNNIANGNLNCGLTSHSTILPKDKKNSLGSVTKTEKNPLKISSNNTSNYNSNNKVESFGMVKININPQSKVNSIKKTKV